MWCGRHPGVRPMRTRYVCVVCSLARVSLYPPFPFYDVKTSELQVNLSPLNLSWFPDTHFPFPPSEFINGGKRAKRLLFRGCFPGSFYGGLRREKTAQGERKRSREMKVELQRAILPQFRTEIPHSIKQSNTHVVCLRLPSAFGPGHSSNLKDRTVPARRKSS